VSDTLLSLSATGTRNARDTKTDGENRR